MIIREPRARIVVVVRKKVEQLFPLLWARWLCIQSLVCIGFVLVSESSQWTRLIGRGKHWQLEWTSSLNESHYLDPWAKLNAFTLSAIKTAPNSIPSNAIPCNWIGLSRCSAFLWPYSQRHSLCDLLSFRPTRQRRRDRTFEFISLQSIWLIRVDSRKTTTKEKKWRLPFIIALGSELTPEREVGAANPIEIRSTWIHSRSIDSLAPFWTGLVGAPLTECQWDRRRERIQRPLQMDPSIWIGSEASR